jgi:hypothetical protein
MLPANTILAFWLIFTPAGPAPVKADAGSNTVLRASGIGRPNPRIQGPRARLMARRAAEVVAVRNLAEKTRLHGRKLGSFRYAQTRYLPDGRVEVTVETILRR